MGGYCTVPPAKRSHCHTTVHPLRPFISAQVFVSPDHDAVLTVVGDILQGVLRHEDRLLSVQTGCGGRGPLTVTDVGQGTGSLESNSTKLQSKAQLLNFAPDRIQRWTNCYNRDDVTRRVSIVSPCP